MQSTSLSQGRATTKLIQLELEQKSCVLRDAQKAITHRQLNRLSTLDERRDETELLIDFKIRISLSVCKCVAPT